MKKDYALTCLNALYFRRDMLLSNLREICLYLSDDNDSVDSLFKRYDEEISKIDQVIDYFNAFMPRGVL